MANPRNSGKLHATARINNISQARSKKKLGTKLLFSTFIVENVPQNYATLIPQNYVLLKIKKIFANGVSKINSIQIIFLAPLADICHGF